MEIGKIYRSNRISVRITMGKLTEKHKITKEKKSPSSSFSPRISKRNPLCD
jgi:hypothetical protein